MKRTSSLKFVLAVVCVSVFAVAAYADSCGVSPDQPQCAPTFSLTWTIQGSNQQHNAQGSAPVWNGSYWLINFTPQNTNQFEFTGGQLTSNPADPFLSYSFGVIDKANAPMIFNFDYTTPYSGPPIFAAEDFFSDRLTYTGHLAGTTSVAPFPDANFPWDYLQNSLVDGVLIPNFQLGKGCTASKGNPCSSAGPYDVLEMYSNSGSGTLEIAGQFILGTQANYNINGETDLYPVPEPSSLVLLGSGVLGFSAMLRRRFMA